MSYKPTEASALAEFDSSESETDSGFYGRLFLERVGKRLRARVLAYFEDSHVFKLSAIIDAAIQWPRLLKCIGSSMAESNKSSCSSKTG